MTNIIYPKRIIESQNLISTQNLLIKKPLQIGLFEDNITEIVSKGFLILDFGKELCGGIRILTYLTSSQCNIRVRFGESLTECSSELGEKNSTNDHCLRDVVSQLVNYSDLSIGNTGFRFVRIDFLDDLKIQIKSIFAVNNILRKKPIYQYKGGDRLIKQIFKTAKRTIDLCASSEYIWDGIKRDRLCWIGDMHPEMLALTTLYGRLKCIEDTLDFVKDQTPLPQWMNGVPMYSMWWIIIIADYYNETGCLDYLKNNIDYLEKLMILMDECVSYNGDLDYPYYFVDWPTHEKEDELAGVRAINIIACKKAIEIQKALNIETQTSKQLLHKLEKIEITVKSSKQVIALKYFAIGKLSDNDIKKLIEGKAKGLSTFMSYYILSAIAKTWGREKAIEIMKEYYGGMLSRGATTFWEDFDIEWLNGSGNIDKIPKKNEKDIHGDFGSFCYKGFRHSLCHGWSSGIIKFIKENCK